jgi:peptidoglycan/xylan/chitin deacetylase (PgdA/CDA1 family)
MPLRESFFRFLAHGLSPQGGRARLSILIYHRILAERDPLRPTEPTVAEFDAEMGLLKQAFNVLPLGEAVARLKAGTLPARAACVTFDDGYADNALLALPVLRKHGLRACFFIATAYLNGGRLFNDTVIEAVSRAKPGRADLSALGLGEHDLSTPEAKADAVKDLLPRVKYLPLGQREAVVAELAERITDQPLPDDLMMTTSLLLSLHEAGMEIGAHTHRHPIIAKLGEAEVRAEIATSAEFLERTLGGPVKLFAYPNGKPGVDYLPEQAEIVRSMGFECAVATHWGAATAATSPFELPRFTPWARGDARFVPQLLRNLANSYR